MPYINNKFVSYEVLEMNSDDSVFSEGFDPENYLSEENRANREQRYKDDIEYIKKTLPKSHQYETIHSKVKEYLEKKEDDDIPNINDVAFDESFDDVEDDDKSYMETNSASEDYLSDDPDWVPDENMTDVDWGWGDDLDEGYICEECRKEIESKVLKEPLTPPTQEYEENKKRRRSWDEDDKDDVKKEIIDLTKTSDDIPNTNDPIYHPYVSRFKPQPITNYFSSKKVVGKKPLKWIARSQKTQMFIK